MHKLQAMQTFVRVLETGRFSAMTHLLGSCERRMVDSHIASGALERVLPDCGHRYRIHVLYPERRHLPLKVRSFIEFLSDSLDVSRELV